MREHYIRENLVLRKVAAANHTTVEEVREKILKAMEIGMNHPDPAVQAFWAQIPCKGNKPTPEELIAFIVGGDKGTVLLSPKRGDKRTVPSSPADANTL